MMNNTYISDLPIHSGEFLKETLEALGMTDIELADKFEIPLLTINEIIAGKKSITSKTAFEFEKALAIPSHIWIGLENEYQIALRNQENRTSNK